MHTDAEVLNKTPAHQIQQHLKIKAGGGSNAHSPGIQGWSHLQRSIELISLTDEARRKSQTISEDAATCLLKSTCHAASETGSRPGPGRVCCDLGRSSCPWTTAQTSGEAAHLPAAGGTAAASAPPDPGLRLGLAPGRRRTRPATSHSTPAVSPSRRAALLPPPPGRPRRSPPRSSCSRRQVSGSEVVAHTPALRTTRRDNGPHAPSAAPCATQAQGPQPPPAPV